MRFPALRLFLCLWGAWTYCIGAHSQFVLVSNDLDLETDHTSGYLGSGVSFADFNGDGWDDLTFGHHAGSVRFYAGTGTGFSEVDLGIELGAAEVKSLLWADIENDGDQDLFVAVRLGPNRLFRNEGDMAFLDVSEACGIGQTATRAYGACFGDYNSDGYLDLFIANYNYNAVVDFPHNELYRNNGDGTFTNVTFSSGDIGEVTVQNFQGHWVDLDGDGMLELHVIRDRHLFQNLHYVQTSPGVFINQAPQAGLNIAINAMSSTVGDFDRDGDLDVFVTGGVEGNILLRNHLGGFEVVSNQPAFDAVRVNEVCWAGNWLDMDNDGWLDLHIIEGYTEYTEFPAVIQSHPQKHSRMVRNVGQEGMVDHTPLMPDGPSVSFASAVGDYNNDGFADLVSHRVGTHAAVLAGVPNGNHWIKVRPTGVVSNRDAVGARLWCWTEGEVMLRMTFCGENYLGQNSRWQIFGLGEYAVVDSLVVAYPSGIVDHYYNIPGETILTLVEGETQGGGGPFPSTSQVLGCMYPMACNYSASAQTDNGTCDFSCLFASQCGEGTVYDWVLLECVPEPGCPGDLTSDGFVSISDLLAFLELFGSGCP